MDIVSFNSSNFIGLSSTYTPDETLSLSQNFLFTEQGFNFPLTELYADLNDTSTNNYSNLYLTRLDTLTSNATIQPLEPLPVDGFSTYIGTYNTPDIDGNTRFLVAQEPSITTNVSQIALSGTFNSLDNRSFFEVLFLDSVFCKIIHSNKGVNRYLTVNSGILQFELDSQQDSLGALSNQIFFYIYDSTTNILVLAKSILDNTGNSICEYVGYTEQAYEANNTPSVAVSGSALTFFRPIQGSNTPCPPNAFLRVSPKPGAIQDTLLYDTWVSYTPDFKTNSQDINLAKSVPVVNTNLLVNNQYNNVVTDGALDINILSLKNTNTPENNQSRNNPFQTDRSLYFTEDQISSRTYNNLFTGSKQELGNDNISIGYDAYTASLTLPADKTTYFHVPQNIYPYIQINVADAGFIEAGAIAGDHPMKSDKIFKKLASAKYTSPFGKITDETSGTFLCSWLSGGMDVNTKPVWLDRYYNPSTVTYIAALTGAPVNYVSTFNTLVSTINANVFDKISDLTLQPGAYYAYQHIGNNYVNQYLQSLTPFLVDNSFSAYLNYNQYNVLQPGLSTNEYVFNGSQYTISNSLSSIDNSNQFTLSFFGDSMNWQQPLGYQLVGNFVHNGFGVFNTNAVTPTLYVPSITGLTILNTSFNTLKTLTYTATPFGFMRLEGLRDYYGMFNDGSFIRYNIADIPLAVTSNATLTGLVDYDYNGTFGYILCNNSGTVNVLEADLNNTTLTDITHNTGIQNFVPNGVLNASNTITVYNNQLYFTPGYQARYNNGHIYFLSQDYTSLLRWDLTLSTVITAFKSYSTIADYNIDFSGNIWLIDSTNNYYSFTSTRNPLVSGNIPTNSTVSSFFNLTGDGQTTTFTLPSTGYSQDPTNFTINYTYTTLLCTASSVYDNNNNLIRTTSYLTTQYSNGTYIPNLEYYIDSNQIVFYTAPGPGYVLSGATTTPIDTYNNSKINFLNDFDSTGYLQTAILTRSGYNPSTQVPSNQFITLSLTGTPLLSSTVDTIYTSNNALTNDNYLATYVDSKYSNTNLNIKAVLTNVYNSSDEITVEIISSLSAVDPGPHHFAIRFDSYHGEMTLFIDGQEINNVFFEPRKYKFSNLIKRPFMFGTATFKNNIPLFKYLQKQAYLVNGLTIYNYNLYNTPLNDYDIKFLARQGMEIQDIVVDIPCGRRNYVEEIERYFKASIPGSKSTLYNLIITNSGITDQALQQALETRILTELKNTAPAYSQINSIKWVN